MGFFEDLSEVVWQQQMKEDADWVLDFFQYIESLSADDVVDMDIPEKVVLRLMEVKAKYGIESFERTYWHLNLLLHQFVCESMPVGRRKELICKAAKVSNLLNEFELQMALLWRRDLRSGLELVGIRFLLSHSITRSTPQSAA